MKCYVTYDVKSEKYTSPVFASSDEDIKRSYGMLINQLIGAPDTIDKSLLYFKKDIELICIGEYDEENGLLTAYKQVKQLGSMDSIYSDFKASYSDTVKTSDIITHTEPVVEKSEEVVISDDVPTSANKISLKKKEVM